MAPFLREARTWGLGAPAPPFKAAGPNRLRPPGCRYFHTPEAGGKVDRNRPTQVGRALHQLGIEHIAAYSPEARGRSERAFGTLQDRPVKELALAGIATAEAANRFIADTYLPDRNRRFATEPELDDSAFVPLLRPGR